MTLQERTGTYGHFIFTPHEWWAMYQRSYQVISLPQQCHHFCRCFSMPVDNFFFKYVTYILMTLFTETNVVARLLTGTGKQSIDRHSSYPVGGPSPHKPGECGGKGNHSRGKMAASLPLLGKMPTPVRPQGSPYIPKFQTPSNSSHIYSLKSY